jgi:hypothetical protein
MTVVVLVVAMFVVAHDSKKEEINDSEVGRTSR